MNISILILNDCPWYFFPAYIYTFLTDSQLLLSFFWIIYSTYRFFLLLDCERYFCKEEKPLIQHWHEGTPLNLGNDQV